MKRFIALILAACLLGVSSLAETVQLTGLQCEVPHGYAFEFSDEQDNIKWYKNKKNNWIAFGEYEMMKTVSSKDVLDFLAGITGVDDPQYTVVDDYDVQYYCATTEFQEYKNARCAVSSRDSKLYIFLMTDYLDVVSFKKMLQSASYVPTKDIVVYDDCTIEITEHEKKTIRGKDYLFVHFVYTNNSDETAYANSKIVMEAFQDGIQIDSAYLIGVESNMLTKVRPGYSLECVRVFEISTDSDVEVEVSKAYDFSRKYKPTVYIASIK